MITKPNQYWKKRYQKESEYVLKCDANEAARLLQEVYLKIAEELIAKINSAYVTTKSEAMLLKRDKELLESIDKKLEALGADVEATLKTRLKQAYKDSAKLTGNYLEEDNRTFMKDSGELVNKAINSVWSDDGLNWSTRVWNDLGALKTTLLNRLSQAVANGEGAMPLTTKLMKDFSVSYSKAKRLAVTEIAHVYTEAAIDRMTAAGITEYEWYTAKDCRVCDLCNSMNGKRFPIDDKDHLPPGATHPQCRCTVLAVVDI